MKNITEQVLFQSPHLAKGQGYLESLVDFLADNPDLPRGKYRLTCQLIKQQASNSLGTIMIKDLELTQEATENKDQQELAL